MAVWDTSLHSKAEIYVTKQHGQWWGTDKEHTTLDKSVAVRKHTTKWVSLPGRQIAKPTQSIFLQNHWCPQQNNKKIRAEGRVSVDTATHF